MYRVGGALLSLVLFRNLMSLVSPKILVSWQSSSLFCSSLHSQCNETSLPARHIPSSATITVDLSPGSLRPVQGPAGYRQFEPIPSLIPQPVSRGREVRNNAKNVFHVRSLCLFIYISCLRYRCVGIPPPSLTF